MEKVIGKILATGVVLLMIWGIGSTLFNLLFRDGRGGGLYGNRGNTYMYNDY